VRPCRRVQFEEPGASSTETSALMSSEVGASASWSGQATAEAWMRALYEAHAEPLYRFLLRLTLGGRQAAEDLLQETLLRAWRCLDELNVDVQTLRPWLFTVARRVAIDAGRARHARPSEVSAIDLAAVAARVDQVDHLVSREAMRRALLRLSPEHRSVIVTIFYRELSVRETAALLGIPEGTVKSRTHHALRSLRNAVR
jgi:RNA polymerase sigma-70 factor, ECF subfamily